ncbi:uncharacterized protein YfaQ (DUF2300 family) [Oxalobacteraceae bacterium GrIS 1.11]
MRLRLRPSRIAALALAVSALPVAGATLDVAWWRDGKLSAVQLQDDGSSRPAPFDGARAVPLGSLWKLFVYLYAVENKLPTPDYHCAGQLPEEVYCCPAGQSVARDAALAQSCGLFFAPARLLVERRPWLAYWTRRLGRAPVGELDWLADPARLTPERAVSLRSLMLALASLPPASRADAEAALLRVVLSARGAHTVSWFGSRLRVKTFSWHQIEHPARRLGGAAGWLADGTPVWFAGADSSSAILQKWAPRLAAILPAAAPAGDAGCVVVDYFARYPIRSVTSGAVAAAPGALHGTYQVRFENGRSLALHSQGDLTLARDAAGRARLQGRFGVNDYVARVLEREGNSDLPEAAKALAVAARSYLQQNAVRAEGCQRIADSSATQRVSPSPAGAAARAIALWTDQLVLVGPNVRYHLDQPGADTLVWRSALEQARQGRRFDDILASAFPRAELTTLAGGAALPCMPLPVAEAWLARELPRWERLLRREPGYERPPELPAVCELAGGLPYSEQSRNRIYLRGLATREDRITLAHEFLHLGLRNHPRGQDEALVEQLARRLVDARLETPL